MIKPIVAQPQRLLNEDGTVNDSEGSTFLERTQWLGTSGHTKRAIYRHRKPNISWGEFESIKPRNRYFSRWYSP